MKYFTKEWYANARSEKDFTDAFGKYLTERKKNFPNEPKLFSFIDQLHDVTVTKVSCMKNDFIISLDNECFGLKGFTDVICIDATVLKKEFESNDLELDWLYSEIYPSHKGYELHIMLLESEPLELIIDCSDIKFASSGYDLSEEDILNIHFFKN